MTSENRSLNTAYDTNAYERAYDEEDTTVEGRKGYKHRDITDGNALYDAYLKARKGSAWKSSVQKFDMEYLIGLTRIQNELKDRTYELKTTSEFILHERGKARAITGEKIEDRIVKHALCDEILTPQVKPYLIYDNGASVKGKGIAFTRKRLIRHLQSYYRQYGNEGYVLLMDFSKYYDNIRHDTLMDMYEHYIDDDTALWLLDKVLKRERVDVSYMTDDEYANCMDTLFNSLDYREIDKSLLTRDKYMDKHLNIGDQVAQGAGIMYRTPIDNYIKIVKSIKYYGAYADDCYILHHDKEYLKQLVKEITEICDKLGITVNRKKTRICKLSDKWRFLQIQYSLTDTGRIMHKINPKRLQSMRERLRKVKRFYTDTDFAKLFNAWFMAHKKYMSFKQKQSMLAFFNNITEVTENGN